MRNLFTPTARIQFFEVLSYIHRDDPSAAVDFRFRAEKSLSRLKHFFESGRFLPEFPDLSFREVIVQPYRLFYRIKGDVVWVVLFGMVRSYLMNRRNSLRRASAFTLTAIPLRFMAAGDAQMFGDTTT